MAKVQLITGNKPTATWKTNCTVSRVVDVYNSIGNCASTYASPAAGVTGNVVRFTAPVAGFYLVNISVTRLSSAQTLLISMYGSIPANNTITSGMEILDLRRVNSIEEAHTISQILYLSTNDYIEPDIYRPVSIYHDATASLIVSVSFLG